MLNLVYRATFNLGEYICLSFLIFQYFLFRYQLIFHNFYFIKSRTVNFQSLKLSTIYIYKYILREIISTLQSFVFVVSENFHKNYCVSAIKCRKLNGVLTNFLHSVFFDTWSTLSPCHHLAKPCQGPINHP